MADDKVPTSLTENLVTLLAHDDEAGKVVAGLIDTTLFDGDYRNLAERLLGYWQQFGQAPKAHTADLLSDILDDPHNRKARTYRAILMNMVALSDGINTAYVLDQIRTFNRMQKLKVAILRSAEQLNSKQHHAITEVEEIWSGLLRTSETTFEPGLRLTEIDKILAGLSNAEIEFKMGVPDLDQRGIVPYRGAMTLILGPAKGKKSWFLVNIGKHALLQRKKVLHITLEMSDLEVAQRYYMALFAIPQHIANINATPIFKRDKDGELSSINLADVKPEFGFDSPYLKEELETRIGYRASLFDKLIIKRFPTRQLTIAMLNGYLDNLEINEKFMPDLLILDYVGIMKTDANNHRISLGRTGEDFRGVCAQRYLAGVTAQQLSKLGAEALQSNTTHVAEDWSLIGTADQTVTISATRAEKQFGLARLLAGAVRGKQDGFGCVITQNISLGQFCLESAYLQPAYFEMLQELSGDKDEEPDSDDEDE